MTSLPPSIASLRGAVDLTPLVSRSVNPTAPVQAAGQQTPGQAQPSGDLVVDVTDATFASVLELSKSVPVIVDLWAEWCEPCKQLSPILEKLVREYGGRIVLAKVDVDANPQLTQAFQAQSIPTVAAVIGGRPVALFSGAYPEAEVRDVFDQVLELAAQNGIQGRVSTGEGAAETEEPVEEPLPPHHAEAYDAITRGDFDTAIAEYQTAIAQNPGDDLARAGLAQVALLARLQNLAVDEVRASAAANPASAQAQLLVADLDVSGGHVDDAFARLLDLYPTLGTDDKDAVRQRLLDYFEIVGPEDPRVGTARRRLTTLLY